MDTYVHGKEGHITRINGCSNTHENNELAFIGEYLLGIVYQDRSGCSSEDF